MPKQIHAAHILVKTEQEANVLYFDVTHGKSFEDMARQKSLCPSGKKGGDLGWFGKGQMVKPFEEVAFAADIGKVPKPFKTQFGWHLMKIVEQK